MSLQLTFFSYGSWIVCIFTAVLSAFLFWIKNRSRSSTYLASAFLFLSLHAFAFVVAYSVVSPLAAYHRWLILFVVPAFTCMGQFFFYYPQETEGRFPQFYFFFQILVWLTFSLYYVGSTLGQRPIFDFSEQIWTFPVAKENKILGVIVVLYSSLMIFSGVWRAWKVRKERNYVTALFVIFFILLIFPPVVANAMSRAGLISRAAFLTTYTFFLIPGSFIVLVLYINTTLDKTRFLNRITGICLGTFLLILYWIALATIGRQEETFDLAKLREAENSIRTHSISKDVLYVSEFHKEEKNKTPIGSRIRNDGNKEFPRQTLISSQTFFPENVERFFVSSESDSSLAVSYRFFLGDKEYELGYPYGEYRKFLHEAILPHFLILTITVFVVLLGFRLFFKGTIWNPLKNLLEGIDRVNEGDLGTQIQVRIRDEIGFLTDSFNGMVSSIREARTALSVYADTLEDQVKDRTSRLTKLLEQQQGDYFLTSLLLKPFGIDRLRNGNVFVESFIRQKKRFVFKEQSHEIGGDISMATSVKIGGADCTVFINADAMGKSIQGAGGAIVLGSVFGSILNRTKLFEEKAGEITPHRWLKAAFLELSKVFEMFEGSMLITAVLGVIEEATGKTFLINAEHPVPILYRNGKASLIPTRHYFNRIGLPFDHVGTFTIQSFQLKPGDCLILGSDGKDDLIVGRWEDGSKKINENQEAFLSRIEAAEGDLDRIYRNLEEYLTDDISILKIEYSSRTQADPVNGRKPQYSANERN
ncbi:SpoIIE family protein phosphatase [Leptospira wolffii]|uniref:SpoIIE family protein phosphatase n=1 Tax=Leptospira wolffii TaxID=409998 RepID=UPI0002FA38E4|nr:SpoIIE family protein phosphatase [Leptospira wolffii]EPG66343.1 SpoIIE-like protein phosphatase domain protein [Leptospira wolffii serovar Khorat str. Khorat-H2]